MPENTEVGTAETFIFRQMTKIVLISLKLFTLYFFVNLPSQNETRAFCQLI